MTGEWIDRLDQWMIQFMSRQGSRIIRISLAIVFIWFGALKVIGRSPVEELVAKTLYWFPSDQAVFFLGCWEIAIGSGLLFGVALRFILLLFWLQLAGTFMVLVLRPDIAFQEGNPFLLTTEGEFVIKNLVLISAGLAVGATVPRKNR